jgi:hypothetical protein
MINRYLVLFMVVLVLVACSLTAHITSTQSNLNPTLRVMETLIPTPSP